MRKFWLLDQHGSDGPTALVVTDGRLQIVDLLRFGPAVTALEDQQAVFDKVIGRVAPTLKPCVNASSLDEEGVEPHADLQRAEDGSGGANRAGRRVANQKASAQREAGGPSRTRSRGER